MSNTIEPFGVYAQSVGKMTTEANGKLGKEDFLAMLIAQMRYQDPLDPQDSSDMIAQMAQFSQLEQSLAQTSAFTGLQAVAMLGRTVAATSTSGTRFSGVVKSVAMNNDMPILTLEDGSLVALKDVEGVGI